MDPFLITYIAVTVFGAGVTLVDMLGALGHEDSADHDGGHEGHAADHADHDSLGDDHGSDHDASDHGAGADYDASSSDHDADHDVPGDDIDAGHDASDHLADHDADHAGHDAADHHADHGVSSDQAHPVPDIGRGGTGSLIAAGTRGVKAVARLASALRTLVYFSLGAGPMGLIGTLRGEGILASALWALISGFIIAVLARTLRRALRRNLDSSLRDEDLLHELAVVVVPIEEGRLGKARVVKYGRETEVYARLSNGRANKGETIRLLRRINGEYLAVRAADLDAGIEKGDEPWTES